MAISIVDLSVRNRLYFKGFKCKDFKHITYSEVVENKFQRGGGEGMEREIIIILLTSLNNAFRFISNPNLIPCLILSLRGGNL